MTATITPKPPPTKEPESARPRKSHKATWHAKSKRRSAPRRPVAPVQWRTVPFAGFIAALLVGGLMTLLVVNNSLAAGSFERARLKAERTLLFEQEQALNQTVLALSSPTMLRKQARRLGMVPAASSAFLDVSTGKIFGIPKTTGPAAPAATDTGVEDALEESDTSALPVVSGAESSVSTPETDGNDGAGAGQESEVRNGREDQATVTDPPATGDGAELSSGTAQDRAIVSGGE